MVGIDLAQQEIRSLRQTDGSVEHKVSGKLFVVWIEKKEITLVADDRGGAIYMP
jgi:hypothetical protein